MSDHDHNIADSLPPNGERVDITKMEGLLRILPAVGGLGIVVCLVLLLTGAGQGAMAYSWLFALYFFMTIATGGFFWVLLHNATNSGWGVAIRRVMEHLAHMLPYVFLFALPIVFIPSVRESLYEWMAHLRDYDGDFGRMQKEDALDRKSVV